MADHQYPPSHHQSHHHHQQYQPPSPASSTDSRSNSSNDRNQFPRNSSSSPVKPTIPPSHPNAQNSNLDRPTASTGNTQGFNAGAVYPPPYNSSSSSSHYPRPSPPPEHQVAYPTSQPGQNPSWGEHNYHPSYHLQQRHISPVHHPNTPSWNPHQPSPPVQPQQPPAQDDPNAQVDQLDDDLTAVPQSAPGPPPVISPPESPPQGSITLTAPNLPYHPRIHYPISSPGSDQPSSRQYSFVSLPGNAMRKRPRRKFDEIERLYACNFPGCTKAYGTLNHLNAHVSMQRHGPKRTPGEFKDMRRARKQAQREQARAAAARDHQEEADGEDNGSPVAGPSTSPASSSRTKRKIRRATEPALQVPRIPSLDDAGPNMPEEFGRMAQASRQQQQLEISRRVSMDDYALQQAAGMMDRRGSGGSDEDTQGDDLADQPGPSSTQRILGASVTMPSGPMGSTEQPLGLHGAHTTSPPALVSSGGQLPPMSMESQGQSMQFWQQHQQPSSVPAQHQAPISPTTVVAPHVSHLPGPGPAVPPGMSIHTSSAAGHRPSWPPSGAYGGGSSSQVAQQQQSGGGPPPLVPATSYSTHHSNPLPFPLQPSVQASQQTQSPHIQQTHIQHSIGVPTPSPPRSAPQTQTQHFQAHSQQQYSASPPPAAAVHRLHQGSMLLTPLNPGGASHRQSYAQEPSGTQSNQPSAYGQTTIGGASAGSSAQGLPSVFELENLSRDPAQDQQQRGSIQQQQQQHAQQSAPIVQQPQTTSWESYQQSSTYSTAGPSHRAPDSYAAPPSLGRSVGYDPSREYYPPTSRPDLYGGQRNVVYGAAVPQSRPEAHPAAYGHPQRSVSYSAPASSDPYMVPGPSQSQRTDAQPPSSYIPARSESYSAVSSRGDPGAAYASAPGGGGRSDPYGAQQQQQRQAPEQQQYQTIPPPQSHIPHHPGLHPQHLPSSDPAHPDPRHDPYGRGHPGPSEGPY